MDQPTLIAKCKGYAADNYSRGFDTFVECYGEQEWIEFLSASEHTPAITTWKAAKSLMDSLADIWDERRANARIEGGE